jgi:hypothetical protein
MEGEPGGEKFDHAAMAESLDLTLDRLKKMGGQLAALTFNSEEVDRRYQAGQVRLAESSTAEIPRELLDPDVIVLG